MNDPVNLPPNNLPPNSAPQSNLPPESCPQCGKQLQSKWVVCPYCGLRLKSADDLLKRSMMWVGVLISFVVAQTLIAKYAGDWAGVFFIAVGLPLAYVFVKAMVYRIRGVPLTWSQLGRTSVRAFFTVVILSIVVPIVIGIAALIFLFMICSGTLGH